MDSWGLGLVYPILLLSIKDKWDRIEELDGEILSEWTGMEVVVVDIPVFVTWGVSSIIRSYKYVTCEIILIC